MRVFFEGNFAPECVHLNRVPGTKPESTSHEAAKRMQPTVQQAAEKLSIRIRICLQAYRDSGVTAAVAFAEPEPACWSCLAVSLASSASEVSAPASSLPAASSEVPYRRRQLSSPVPAVAPLLADRGLGRADALVRLLWRWPEFPFVQPGRGAIARDR